MEKLVSRGKIPPDTPIRRTDDEHWGRSDQINQYGTEAPSKAVTRQRPNPRTSESSAETAVNPTGGPTNMAAEAASSAAASVRGIFNVAADASKLTAMKARDLPAAKAAIARKAIELGLVPETDSQLQQIRQIESEIANLQQPTPIPDGESVGQKTSRLAKEAKKKVQVETTRQRLGKSHAALGGSLYGSMANNPPPGLESEIQKASAISEEISALENSIDSKPGDKKKAILAAAAIGLLLLIGGGMYFFGGGDDSDMSFASSATPAAQPNTATPETSGGGDFEQREAARIAEERRRMEEQKRLAAEREEKRREEEQIALAKMEQERKEREARKRAAEEKDRREAAAKAEAERQRILARQKTIEDAMKRPDDWLLVRRPSPDSKVLGRNVEVVDAKTFESLGSVNYFGESVSPVIGSAALSSPGTRSFERFGVLERPGSIWNPVVSDAFPTHKAEREIIYSEDRVRCLKIEDGDLVRGVLNWKQGAENFEGKITNIGLVDKFKLLRWRGNTLTMQNPSNPTNPIVEINLISGDFSERPPGPFEELSGAIHLTDGLRLQATGDRLRFVNLASLEVRDLPNKKYLPHPGVPGKKDATSIPLIGAPRLVDGDSWRRAIGNDVKMVGEDVCVATTGDRKLLAIHIPTMRTKSIDLGFGDQIPVRGRRSGRVRILDVAGKKVICQLLSDDAANASEELYTYKLVDLGTGTTTPLPPTCFQATWIDDNHFVYLVEEGGVGDIGVWLHSVDTASDQRLSARPEFGSFVLSSDNQTMLADLGSWQRVDLSSGEVRTVDALAEATRVVRFATPIDLDLYADIQSAWGSWNAPEYFAIEQSSIPGFDGKEFELANLINSYDGTVREAMKQIVATQSRVDRCLDMVAYLKLIAPVVTQMAAEGNDVDSITNGGRYEFPVSDELDSCIDEDHLRILIYDRCYEYATRHAFANPQQLSDVEKEKISRNCLKTVEKCMRDRGIKSVLVKGLILHNTKSLTVFGSKVLQIYSQISR
ncbi:hypothetical protein CGZ80_27205 [Rhodopirellula sp. MGV]|nr:hypothetical protein CGZ80_27205 [Rhodopirellula sp. MGV]PNY38631.1 hypothetical protein C2E31_01565 [Rhodopirellula baltica]